MPKLGEFIGALLSDAAQARVQADMEALKIAEAYSSHELLKHLPVPRFRLPDITVDFPVLVTALVGEPAANGGRPFDAPKGEELAKAVRAPLGELDKRLPTSVRDTVAKAVVDRAERLFSSGPQFLLSPGKVASDLAAAALNEVRAALKDRDVDDAKLEGFGAAAQASFKALLLAKLVKSPFLQVSVAAGDIKAHDDNESVMRLRLTITEDAYEVINRDEGPGFILTPE